MAKLDVETLGLDPPPTLMTREPDESRPDEWLLEAYFEGKPDAVAVARIGALSALGAPHNLEPLGDEDWVTMSQAGLEPVIAGRFFVKTPYDPAEPPASTPFIIDAGAHSALGIMRPPAAAGDDRPDRGRRSTDRLAGRFEALEPDCSLMQALRSGQRLMRWRRTLTLSRLRSQRIMPSSTASRWAGNPVNAR